MSAVKRAMLDKAASLLAGLGRTPNEIAETLRGAGYKGVMMSPTGCPCGSCLSDHLGVEILVGNHFARFQGMSIDEGAPLAAQVRAFVGRFDGGIYPDLIAEKP